MPLGRSTRRSLMLPSRRMMKWTPVTYFPFSPGATRELYQEEEMRLRSRST